MGLVAQVDVAPDDAVYTPAFPSAEDLGRNRFAFLVIFPGYIVL